jgi:hypothetical protein
MAFGLRRCELGQSFHPLLESYVIHITDDTGELLGWKQLGTHIEQDYGAPYYHIHVRLPPYSTFMSKPLKNIGSES